jgi:hypothetical protein
LRLLAAASGLSAQGLDFNYFRTKVEPIFLTKRPGHARCIVCHSGGRAGFALVALAKGVNTFTEEQSRTNFEKIRVVVNAQNPEASALLKHPLAGEAGGDDFHSGGRQFASKQDPNWQTILAWIKGAK